jgi:hypothetical protein
MYLLTGTKLLETNDIAVFALVFIKINCSEIMYLYPR